MASLFYDWLQQCPRDGEGGACWGKRKEGGGGVGSGEGASVSSNAHLHAQTESCRLRVRLWQPRGGIAVLCPPVHPVQLHAATVPAPVAHPSDRTHLRWSLWRHSTAPFVNSSMDVECYIDAANHTAVVGHNLHWNHPTPSRHAKTNGELSYSLSAHALLCVQVMRNYPSIHLSICPSIHISIYPSKHQVTHTSPQLIPNTCHTRHVRSVMSSQFALASVVCKLVICKFWFI